MIDVPTYEQFVVRVLGEQKAAQLLATPYDSAADTLAHIQEVQRLMRDCMAYIRGQMIENQTHTVNNDTFQIVLYRLQQRAFDHDASKLEQPEKGYFDRYTPLLRSLTYMSDAYTESLNQMRDGLRLHYGRNAHHPEHHAGGIRDMTLFDLLEMLCDWAAAVTRHADGSLVTSFTINRERFQQPYLLHRILENTVVELGWVDRELFPPGSAVEYEGVTLFKLVQALCQWQRGSDTQASDADRIQAFRSYHSWYAMPLGIHRILERSAQELGWLA